MKDLLAPDALIDRFQTAVNRRVAAEQQIATRFESGEDPEEVRYRTMLSEAERAVNGAMAAVHADYADISDQLDVFEASERERISAEFSAIETRAIHDYDTTIADIDLEYREKGWVVDSLIDEQADDSPQRRLDLYNTSVERATEFQSQQLSELRKRIENTAAYWRTNVPDVPPLDPTTIPAELTADALDEQFQNAVATCEEAIHRLGKLKLARWTRGIKSLGWFVVVTAAIAAPLGLLGDPSTLDISADKWWPIVGGLAAFVGFAVTMILAGTGFSSRKNAWNTVASTYFDAAQRRQAWQVRTDSESASIRRDLEHEIEETSSLKTDKQHKMAIRRAEREETAAKQRDQILADARTHRDEQLATLEATLAEQRGAAEAEYARRRQQTETTNANQLTEASGRLRQYLDGRSGEFDRLRKQLTDGWRTAVETTVAEVRTRHAQADVLPWNALADSDWQPAAELPRGLRLGDLIWTTSEIPSARSSRAELAALEDEVIIPATLDFPGNPSVVFRGQTSAARSVAEQTLLAFVLRAMTSLPPAQMRVTLLDPVGLGEPFAPLMHLTDVDERLVSGRIWTEPQQIEAQLADLTEHMENVLQTYLRGDFPTIEAYNEMAGEVAEPYRFLVVNGFPHRFTEPAIRRLLSIASSGPRCGVFLAVYHDLSVPATNNLSLDGLTDAAEILVWDESHACYVLRDREALKNATQTVSDLETAVDFFSDSEPSEPPTPAPSRAPLSLRFQPPRRPEPSDVGAIVRNIARASKDAGRVEVSFSKIAPLPDRRWTSDSRRGLDVPLGRAGATKLQHARFGRGTAQHMLVAGKTGSGKSTFLHALITNAALHYSPSELRFYLIDFKKGVEFKAYAPTTDAQGRKFLLPHADVIAVESEREFGVSALKRLDELLNERGEQFRAAGVQDIGQFRDENPDIAMPRVMLLIDEFQEFFVEDDAIAQQASLLLDRLVRQGRAFGVHCVLGSQTLGGAYSLARSTLGQIGIRVALQCSEADAHLILAEDNTAARLLARPGEAIYNDAGGLIEGNQPFQVAYLTDEQREGYLSQLTRTATDQGTVSAPVVFEGNKPATLTRTLLDDISADGRLSFAFGDAVEIKPPTAVTLTRRSAGNVLVVGTDANQNRGLLVAAALQLASRANVHVLHTPDSDDGCWKRVVGSVGGELSLYASTDIPDLMALLDTTRADADADKPYVLIIDGLPHFRSLRRPEDDYGFGGSALKNPFADGDAEPPPVDPGQAFATLLSDGPERNRFVIAACEGYTAADRALSRKGLREFGTRVLFRLSANDSSSLIDTPAASKLDSLRGLVYDDATGESEKFRPFSTPDDETLERLHTPTLPSARATTAGSDASLEPAALDDFLVH